MECVIVHISTVPSGEICVLGKDWNGDPAWLYLFAKRLVPTIFPSAEVAESMIHDILLRQVPNMMLSIISLDEFSILKIMGS